MRAMLYRIILACILLGSTFSLSGCFSTLQTAKTHNGLTVTTGLYRYTFRRHLHLRNGYHKSYYETHYLLIWMPRYGRAAAEKRFGWEVGLRVITDVIESYGSGKSGWLLGEEFKLQIPKNRYLDLSGGLVFWGPYPGSFCLYFSKDLSRTFTLYGSGELFGGLYTFPLRNSEKKISAKFSLGSEINLSHRVSALAEVEKWFNTGWDLREEFRFAGGVKIFWPKEGK